MVKFEKILLSALVMTVPCLGHVSAMESKQPVKEMTKEEKENAHKMMLMGERMKNMGIVQEDVRGKIGGTLHELSGKKITCPTVEEVKAHMKKEYAPISKYSNAGKYNFEINGIKYKTLELLSVPVDLKGFMVVIGPNKQLEDIYCDYTYKQEGFPPNISVDLKSMNVDPKNVTFDKNMIYDTGDNNSTRTWLYLKPEADVIIIPR